MADTKISDLAAVTTLISTDEFVLARSGDTKKIDAADLSTWLGFGGDGWVAANETWTYGAADDPTYTFTIAGVDLTTKYSPGMRVRLAQSTGGTKYGIVTKVVFSTDTTVTVYMGTDYDLVNEAITAPYYSLAKAPLGFPLDPAKWTVTLSDTADRSQSSPAQNTWYNLGSLTLNIPIGSWDVWFGALLACNRTSGSLNMEATLSTANNTESDVTMTMRTSADASANLQTSLNVQRQLTLTAKTAYYLNGRTTQTSVTTIRFLGDTVDTTVRVVCAYL